MNAKKSGFSPKCKHASFGLLLATGVFGFSMATLLFLLAPYLRSIFHTENIFWLYAIPEIFVLGFFSFFLRRAKYLGRTRVFFAAIVFQIFILFSLIVCEGSWKSVVSVAAYLFLIPFFMMLFDAFLEEESANEEAGRMRGLHILFFNGGMLPAPFVAGMIMERFGFSGVFLLVIGCYVCMGLEVYAIRRKKRDTHISEMVLSWHAAREKISRNPDLVSIYLVSVLLEGFYVMTIFTFPLFLADSGLDFSQAGTVFTIMLLPFLIFAYPAGHLADTRWGEKEMLVGALLFLSVVLVGIAATVSSNMWVWAALLPLTRVGASLIETMRDAYFYKHVEGKDFDLIAFFRTARSVGIVFATLTTFVLFSFTHSFRVVFLAFSIVLLAGAIFSLRIRDTEPNTMR